MRRVDVAENAMLPTKPTAVLALLIRGGQTRGTKLPIGRRRIAGVYARSARWWLDWKLALPGHTFYDLRTNTYVRVTRSSPRSVQMVSAASLTRYGHTVWSIAKAGPCHLPWYRLRRVRP